MVMNSIKDAKQLSKKLPDILTDLESRLNSSWKGDPWQLKSIEKPKYFVKFKMSRSSEDVKVDLLPRFEANVGTDAGTYLITSRLVALLIIKFVSTWLSSQPLITQQNFIPRASPILRQRAGKALSSIPHSRTLYVGNEVKFSAQWLLGSLERTSVSSDWSMVCKATINQSYDTIFHPNDPRNPTSSPGLFPPIFWGKSPGDEVPEIVV